MSSSTFHFLSANLLLCLVVTLFQHHFTFVTPKPTGLSLRAVPDNSPESPLYHFENLSITERVEKLIKISYAKANYSIMVLNPNAEVNIPDYIQIPVVRDALIYAVTFTIGSQEHLVRLLMDTGGGLTWTQCEPCINCFPQNLPTYDPRASTRYATLPCDHPLCHGDNRIFNCINDKCIYDVGYGGGAFTSGVASLETFQFFVDSYHTSDFNNIIFGCSNDNHNFVFQNSDVSGIFGLSLAPDSMATQLSNLTRSQFSYCLVPFRDAMPRPILLRFGDDIPELPAGSGQTTTLVPRPGAPYFYLQLLDISVSNCSLGFDPNIFNFRPNMQGGCIIDSGTLATFIDSNTPGVNAYQEVMNVFAAYYESRNLRRVEEGLGFQLCYESPPGFDDYASITFHLNGANYTVDGKYGHFIAPTNFFCVAILEGNSETMLGAWYQQNKRLIYDANMGVLHFANEECVNE